MIIQVIGNNQESNMQMLIKSIAGFWQVALPLPEKHSTSL